MFFVISLSTALCTNTTDCTRQLRRNRGKSICPILTFFQVNHCPKSMNYTCFHQELFACPNLPLHITSKAPVGLPGKLENRKNIILRKMYTSFIFKTRSVVSEICLSPGMPCNGTCSVWDDGKETGRSLRYLLISRTFFIFKKSFWSKKIFFQVFRKQRSFCSFVERQGRNITWIFLGGKYAQHLFCSDDGKSSK